MSVFEYVVLALAMGINLLVVMLPCAAHAPIRLTKGLCVSLIAALFYAAFIMGGLTLGNVMRFSDPNGIEGGYTRTNELVYLGLMVVVGVKMLTSIRKKDSPRPTYDISRWLVVVLLSVATGVNVFLSGMAFGFVADFDVDMRKAVIPVFVITFFLCYLAIMLGRQKKKIKERRWLLIAVLLVLVSAFFRVL